MTLDQCPERKRRRLSPAFAPCRAGWSITAALLAFALCHPAFAQQPSPPRAQSLRDAANSIKQGNRLLDESRFEEALAEYDKARSALPESAEASYDRGIALYRMGRYAEAEKAFQDALEPGNLELEAKSKYNLGRSAHAAALEKKDNLPDAINDLGRAISFYNDALQITKEDQDAKLNKEAAERLRAYLEKLMQQQQQEKEKKENQTSQPNEEPTSQPDEKQPSSQPSEQEKNEQNKEQEGDQNKEGEEEKQSDKEGDEQKDQEQKDQQSKDQQQKDQQGKSNNQDKKGEGQKGQQQQSQAKEQEGKMSEEEAEPMLQEARDAERERREANRMRMMRLRGRIPVKKDW